MIFFSNNEKYETRANLTKSFQFSIAPLMSHVETIIFLSNIEIDYIYFSHDLHVFLNANTISITITCGAFTIKYNNPCGNFIEDFQKKEMNQAPLPFVIYILNHSPTANCNGEFHMSYKELGAIPQTIFG